MAKPNAVGIDLGTTYSAVAWFHHSGHTEMVRNGEGDMLTPSVVLFDKREVIVGKEAKKSAILHADRVAETVKRDMGNPVYSRPIRGEYLPPEVIQAYILRKLKTDTDKAVGAGYRVVITVPAFFDEPRRRATAQAGEMSELDVLDIVNEPTAAALAFGEEMGFLTATGTAREPLNVLVYDLGGGTFDVTLVRLEPGHVRTLATDGDVRLGGHDWDMRLVDFVAERFVAEHREDPRSNPSSLQRLLTDVEEAKHTLSSRQQTKIRCQHAGSSTTVEVTREQFESITADLLDRTAVTTRQVLADAKLTWAEVDRLLLVGGSTRMPMVVRMLEQTSSKKPDHSVHPDEAVARGAAIYAHHMLSTLGDEPEKPKFKITNISSHSLGVEGIDAETLTRRNMVLIPRNTPLPARASQEFATKTTGQASIVVQVLEGESFRPSECAAIGRMVIRDLPRDLPKGAAIDVSFEYAVNGRLSVAAQIRHLDKRMKLDLERDALSDERVRKWRKVVAGGSGADQFDELLAETMQDLRAASHRIGSPGDAAAAESAPAPIPMQPIPLSMPTRSAAPQSARPTPGTAAHPAAQSAYQSPSPTQVAANRPSPTLSMPQSPWPQSPPMQSPGMHAQTPYAPARDMAVPRYAPSAAMAAAPAPASDYQTGLPARRSALAGMTGFLSVLVAYGIGATLGLSLGYYILCCLNPERYNVFNLPVVRISTENEEPETEEPETESDAQRRHPAPAPVDRAADQQ